jgi:succinate dehydrogenase / fumarate reductase cytochrome b subunit
MLRRLAEFLRSSIGKKVAMALSGIALYAFLVAHLLGNLTLLGGNRAFNAYAEKLRAAGPLLVAAEIGLALVAAVHVYLAVRVSLENRDARLERYRVRASRGAASAGSLSMLVTGAIVLVYTVVHLLDFRFDADFEGDPAALVERRLSQPSTAAFYVICMGALTLHLSHAFQSAWQTLGVSHPPLRAGLRALGLALALALGIGFALLPALCYAGLLSAGGNG